MRAPGRIEQEMWVLILGYYLVEFSIFAGRPIDTPSDLLVRFMLSKVDSG